MFVCADMGYHTDNLRIKAISAWDKADHNLAAAKREFNKLVRQIIQWAM